jgi:hypothetical protein
LDPYENKLIVNEGNYKMIANVFSYQGVSEIRFFINEIELIKEGLELENDNNNTFTISQDVPLKEGENEVYISVSNVNGTVTSKKKIIIFEPRYSPQIIWMSPSASNSIVKSKVSMGLINITSFQKLESIQVYLNGKVVPSIPEVKPVEGKKNTVALQFILNMQNGENEVYATAKNSAGTGTSEKRYIYFQIPDAPVLTWEIPASKTTNTESGTIKVSAKIKTESELISTKIMLNGSILPDNTGTKISSKDSVEYYLESNLNLVEGENELSIITTNKNGYSRSETRTIINNYKPKPETKPEITLPQNNPPTEKKTEVIATPSFTWIAPSQPTSEVNQYSAFIRASINSFEQPKAVVLYLNGKGTELPLNILTPGLNNEYLLEQKINLLPGNNNFYLVAANSSGTAQSEIRNLVNPPDNPPAITWNNPALSRAIVNSENYFVEACIKSVSDLKSVKVIVNGLEQASDMIFSKQQADDCQYTWRKPVILKEGENNLYVIATNNAGSQQSEKRIIQFESLLSEKRLALIFGNSDYRESGSLKNPSNDANLMEATLKNLNFDIIKYLNADKATMELAIKEFSKRLPDYNVALFYYAGHGVQVDGLNYFIPVDATLNDKTDCKWEAISVNYVVEEFERYPENINIVILDACRVNPFRSWARGDSQGFKAITAASGTIISFATSEGSVAADGFGSNGLFTEELVKQITVPQSIESVFKNTRINVEKRSNGTQSPQESSKLKGDFYFRK